MARPSHGVDQALLDAGMAEIREAGVGGISVRSVCARAGVSIRMLSYYFGNKDDFIREVLTRSYQAFFDTLLACMSEASDPLSRLEKVVRISTVHTVADRQMSQRLWVDAMAGDPLVLELMNRHEPNHSELFLQLIREAQGVGQLRSDMPAEQIYSAIFPGVFMPSLLANSSLPQFKNLVPEMNWDAETTVDKAIQNFWCLLEGFRTGSNAGPRLVSSPIAMEEAPREPGSQTPAIKSNTNLAPL